MVDKTLKHHLRSLLIKLSQVELISLTTKQFYKSVYDAGVNEICKNGEDEKDGFIYPSYVEDILGAQLFDYGYGHFRWVCLSGKPEDLDATDQAAMECIDVNRRYQDRDNYNWVRDAKKNKLVVGTQARILYQDANGKNEDCTSFQRIGS